MVENITGTGGAFVRARIPASNPRVIDAGGASYAAAPMSRASSLTTASTHPLPGITG